MLNLRVGLVVPLHVGGDGATEVGTFLHVVLSLCCNRFIRVTFFTLDLTLKFRRHLTFLYADQIRCNTEVLLCTLSQMCGSVHQTGAPSVVHLNFRVQSLNL